MTRTGSTLAGLLLLAAGGLSPAAHAAGALRIGLQEDPDFLDPARSRSYVSRIVFASLCDKLIDTAPDLKFVPQLALSWTWSDDNRILTLKLRPNVTFQDGEPFDAEAVKFNLDRYRTLPESVRKSEIASVDHVDVVDPLTVNLVLKQPDAALVAQLTDRSGMMMAPKATQTANATANPVCSGPYKFAERVAQDRIVLDRFANYWNAGAYTLDRVTFMPIPDATVRLANLQSGGLDLIERMAATDVKSAQADSKLQVISIPGLAFDDIEINVSGPSAQTPMGRDKRVRQAFDLAIDRDALNQAVYEGRYTPGHQPFAPASPYHIAGAVPGRDVDKAKALLKAAGVTAPVTVKLTLGNDTVTQQVGQVLQAMVGEAGFDLQLQTTEFATLLSQAASGDFQATLEGWSGRVDPDGNIHQFVTCKGGLNDMKYCDSRVDELLNGARTVTDPAERKTKYEAAMKILWDDKPIVYLDFTPRIFGAAKALHGFVPHPDGMIRLQNVTLDK